MLIWGTVMVCSDIFSLVILLLFIFGLECWSDSGGMEKNKMGDGYKM